MPTEVPRWSLEQLKALAEDSTVMVVTKSCEDRAAHELPFAKVSDPPESGNLVVIGGGSLMDEMKFRARGVRLVCVPSLYGSGAEVSPIVILNSPEGKRIEVDDAYTPDARVYWPELLETVPEQRARDACGDVWSHALEAFISPLADETLRAEITALIADLSAQPLESDAAWFELSAQACLVQSRCSVGLIHGIAHTLEPILNDAGRFGHAALCAILLWPVLRFNREHSDKWAELITAFEVDERAVETVARNVFDPERFKTVCHRMADHWDFILRDRCTRTNGVLVRPNHLDFFLSTDFS